MTREEFAKRTSTFLPSGEIGKYEDEYEPAYMAAAYTDKDDFCAMLKDARVRKFVKGVSRVLAAKESLKAQFRREWKSAVAERDEESLRKEEALKALSLIASMCDRAVAEAGRPLAS